MTHKQTRRSISVSRELYDALKTKAQDTSGSQSGIVEAAMRELLGLPPRNLKRSKPAPVLELVPEVEEEVEISEKATAMRRQAVRDTDNRVAMIKAAAEKKREQADRKIDSQGGIFTF
jgi:hypothetical protein